MKNKILNSGFGIGTLIFVAAVIIALPLRLYQYIGGILEPQTGFYAQSNWSIYLLYGILAVAIVAVVIFGLLSSKKLAYDTVKTVRPGFGALSGLVAAGMILDTFACLQQVGNLEELSASAESSPELTTRYVILAQIIFAFLSAIYFVILCVGSLTGKSSGAEFKLVSLMPVLWSMLRMVARFMRTISYVRVSELMFEMLMLAFMILFFMNFAQCNSKVNDENCGWKLAAYGLPAALMALVCSVPRLILAITGKSDVVYTGSMLEYSDIAVALFIIATVLTRVTLKPNNDTTTETTEE